MKKVQLLYVDLGSFFQTLEDSPIPSVHGIRKRTKYMRALLKIDREPAQQSIVILKNISRILSPYRDAQVIVDTFRKFSTSKIHKNDPVVEEFLLNNPFYEDPEPDMFEMHTLNDLMAQLAIEINSLKPEVDQAKFEEWLNATIASATRRYKRVLSSNDKETVHSWRKKTKQAWYLQRFKHGEEVSDPNHLISQYDQVGKRLGEVHDLDMLREFILSHFKKYPAEPLMQYRNEILTQATLTAENIFS